MRAKLGPLPMEPLRPKLPPVLDVVPPKELLRPVDVVGAPKLPPLEGLLLDDEPKLPPVDRLVDEEPKLLPLDGLVVVEEPKLPPVERLLDDEPKLLPLERLDEEPKLLPDDRLPPNEPPDDRELPPKLLPDDLELPPKLLREPPPERPPRPASAIGAWKATIARARSPKPNRRPMVQREEVMRVLPSQDIVGRHFVLGDPV